MNRRKQLFRLGVVSGILLLIMLFSFSSTSSRSVGAQAVVENPVGFLTGPNAGTPQEIALGYVRNFHKDLGIVESDLAEYVIVDQYQSAHNKTTHIYLQQYYDGIKVHNAILNINISGAGEVINVGNRFVPNLAQSVNKSTPQITAVDAVNLTAADLGLEAPKSLNEVRSAQVDDASQKTVFGGAGISRELIPVSLVYQPLADGTVRLAWETVVYEIFKENWWSTRVDAVTGEILDQHNLVIHDNFGVPESAERHAAFDIPYTEAGSVAARPFYQTTDGSSYNVYALPVESPNHGSRTIVNEPADSVASPYGWHDTNGSAGAEFTTTRGNNVNAYEDGNNPGFQPNAGSGLDFNYPINFSQHPDNYEAAAITNLFYWNNIIHDVMYQYGFDEASGNFQENNYGRGGAGSDSVNAEAQDGSGTNNANFSTPTDGGNPRMQMYLWTAPNPDKDGDLDNGIIIHEYGHGISIRLTGGPGTSSCLNNTEQAGEGWSDYFAVLMTIESGDSGPDRRGVGTYALNQSTTGDGIRDYPYSTSMSIDPRTYDAIKSASIPHGVGSVWAAMVWEMTWGLIDAHGFDPDLYNGNGGNNIALQLVIDGLKLQPCSPGFVNARDAILLADQNNNGGANQCIIWEAFAKRGLGVSASQGSSGSRSDGTEAFDIPSECSGPTPTPSNTPPPPTSTATSTPLPGNVIFFDDFETNQGWTTNPSGTDTATTGQWERANPEQTSSGSTTLQLGTTVSGNFDLVTEGSAGSSAGTNDIDNGVTSIRSPNIALPSSGDIALTFSHYMGLLSNANTDDYLRVTVVGSSSQVVYEELGNGTNRNASWDETTVSLNSFAGQTIYLLIEAADGGSGSLVEAGVDDVSITADEAPPTATAVPPTNTPIPPTNTPVPPTNTPIPPTNTPAPPTSTPPPSGDVFFDDFETNQGWTTNPNGTDTATTGQWERANPETTTYNGATYQQGTTTSGSFDLVTEGSAGSSVGANDIDGGTTSIRSPNISLPSSGNLTLSFDYYLSHYSNGSSADFLRVSVVGSSTAVVFEELAAANIDAATWDSFSTSLNSFAGQTVYILIEAADASGGSLVEAAVDDVRISVD